VELQRLDLNKLHTFFAVAECGGVSAAARRLALTPSAVSQALAALEESLEVRLFHRVGRRLVPTREGDLLHRRFREVEARLRETLAEVRNEEREPRGLLRIGLFVGFPRRELAQLIARVCRAHPALRLRLLYASLDELDQALLAGRCDAVLSFDPGSRAAGRIRAVRLFEQELVLVSGRRFLRGPFDLEQLAATPVVDYYQSDPLILRWARHHYRRRPPALRVRVWAATTNLVLDLVLRQVGVGVLPRHVAAPELGRARLRAIEPGRRPLRDAMWLKHLAGADEAPALAAFREAALDAFAATGARGS
jgi:DNA-binding transcriptional LysR family regulator